MEKRLLVNRTEFDQLVRDLEQTRTESSWLRQLPPERYPVVVSMHRYSSGGSYLWAHYLDFQYIYPSDMVRTSFPILIEFQDGTQQKIQSAAGIFPGMNFRVLQTCLERD